MKKIRALTEYHDLQLNRTIKAGEEYEVSDERALVLTTTDNKAKTVLAEIIESPTPTEKVAKAAPKKKKTEVK